MQPHSVACGIWVFDSALVWRLQCKVTMMAIAYPGDMVFDLDTKVPVLTLDAHAVFIHRSTFIMG